ncbi:hypothetical protein GCM10011329_37730 [Stakelama pacifica]|nr:hypothetical protein GCM10011329_37730 [Stakelama pacifica]
MTKMNKFLSKEKATALLAAEAAKGQTKAKSAHVPQKKAATFKKFHDKAAEANAVWERPNLLALCRKLAGGDLAAGYLLHHILYVWNNRDHKLERKLPTWSCDQWLAHSRQAWATASGLTLAEFTKRALPRLRKNCWGFLMIRAMGNGPQKKLWVSVDVFAMQAHISGSEAVPWDMFHAALEAMGPGFEKTPANAYAKPT